MHVAIALLAGLIFGVGILFSGMGNPAKVLNFFDIAGNWDPSLAFVMAGALAVTAIGYRIVFGRKRPLFAETFALPATSRIEPTLIGGAAVFGFGWGLSGFCPGGLIPVLGTGYAAPAVFFAGLMLGLWMTRVYRTRGQRIQPAHPPRPAN